MLGNALKTSKAGPAASVSAVIHLKQKKQVKKNKQHAPEKCKLPSGRGSTVRHDPLYQKTVTCGHLLLVGL